MPHPFHIRLIIVFALLTMAVPGHACSWAIGYFYQVTTLRGTVVGVNQGDPRQFPDWMRHQVTLGNVRMSLYKYEWPVDWSKKKPLKTTTSNSDGKFDFGALPEGHYTMRIKTPWGGDDSYDVQIVPGHSRRTTELIDISPNLPDCTGGHQFIITAQ
jgi:hypothetical protein